MAKLALTASPTFKSPVAIPVPGKKPVPVEFIFKGRTKSEFQAFVEALRDRDDVDVILDIASGWELDDAFDKDSISKMLDSYIGAARAIIDTYLLELTSARLGN